MIAKPRTADMANADIEIIPDRNGTRGGAPLVFARKVGDEAGVEVRVEGALVVRAGATETATLVIGDSATKMAGVMEEGTGGSVTKMAEVMGVESFLATSTVVFPASSVEESRFPTRDEKRFLTPSPAFPKN